MPFVLCRPSEGSSDTAADTGYGLSYSEFAYTASPSSLGSHHPCQAVHVEVALSLTGGPTVAEEVAQVYVALHNASVAPVARHQLVTFTRVRFGGTEDAQQRLSFTLLPGEHGDRLHTPLLAGLQLLDLAVYL